MRILSDRKQNATPAGKTATTVRKPAPAAAGYAFDGPAPSATPSAAAAGG